MSFAFVEGMAAGSNILEYCSLAHRITPLTVLQSDAGSHSICQFAAPDIEAVRIALRVGNVSYARLWRGFVYRRPGAVEPGTVVVLARPTASPLTGEPDRLDHQHVLGTLGVRMAYVSLDWTRIIALIARHESVDELPADLASRWTIESHWRILDPDFPA